jgi:hypothetical protein
MAYDKCYRDSRISFYSLTLANSRKHRRSHRGRRGLTMMEKITKRKMMKSKKMMIVIMIVTATRTMIAIMGKKRKTPMKEMEVKMMRKESMRALSTKPTLLKVLKHNGEILSRSSSCL